jgi:hypothetical protein
MLDRAVRCRGLRHLDERLRRRLRPRIRLGAGAPHGAESPPGPWFRRGLVCL